MIKVTLSDRTLGFSFRHTEVKVPEYEGPSNQSQRMSASYKPGMRKTRATYCSFFEVNEKGIHWLVDGIATVGVGDQFNKWVGRKISLERAVEQLKDILKLSREDREKIWNAYWRRGIIEGEVVKEGTNETSDLSKQS